MPYFPFVKRFTEFLRDFYAIFPWSVPHSFDVRLNGTNPFFLLSYGAHGFMRFAHHSDDEFPDLVMQSADGALDFQGSTQIHQLPNGWQLIGEFKPELSMPWEHRMAFFGLDDDGSIFREVYRKGHNVAVTYARVNEQ